MNKDKILLLCFIGVILSCAMEIYFENLWFLVWLGFSVLIGNEVSKYKNNLDE